jgi:hypothetical protein
MLYRKALSILALLPACLTSATNEDVAGSAPPVATVTAAITSVPAFKSLSTVQNATTIARPAGLAAGDFLLAALEYDATPVMLTPPPGWTLVADQISGVGTAQVFHALVYSHIATSSEPAQYMFTAPADVYVDIQIADYTGVTAVHAVSSLAALTTTIAAPNLFTTQANELLVSVFIDFDFGSWTVASGETQRSDFDANSLQDVLIPEVGPTNKHPASNTSSQQVAINVLLK